MARPPDIAKRKKTEADLVRRMADAMDLADYMLRELPTTPPEAAMFRRYALLADVPKGDRTPVLALAYEDPGRFFREVAPALDPGAFDERSYVRFAPGLARRQARRLIVTCWTWGAGALLHPVVRAAFDAAPGPVLAAALAVIERKVSTYAPPRGKDTKPRRRRVDHVERAAAVEDALFDVSAAREADVSLPARRRRQLPRGAVAEATAKVAAEEKRTPSAVRKSRRKGSA